MPVPPGCSVRPFADEPGRCDRCGKALTGQQRRWCGKNCPRADVAEHRWTQAREERRRRDGYRCTVSGCGRRERLQVDHIDPRWGAGYGWGCHNHQDNLQTLCLEHHQEKTRRQVREGRPTE